MKVAIYGQFFKPELASDITILLEALLERNFAVTIEYQYVKHIHNLIPKKLSYDTFKGYNDLNQNISLLLSIGGDGTILRAITYVRDLGIPILGINMGRLGFLATVPKEKIKEAITEISLGKYDLSKRSLLEVKTKSIENHFGTLNFALNEIAISRKNTTSMITIDTYLDEEFLTSYWADGLIIATPTGSTGYSLSCGGPVITPSNNSIVLTPIAPHNLNARPLVIPDNTIIKLKVSGREKTHLVSLDSRIITLDNETEIFIKNADFTINMAILHSDSFLQTLRKKLLWGEDKRN